MQTKELIRQIDIHANATGLSRATICERATGNSRLYDRLVKRMAHDADIAQRIAAFIASNPAPQKEGAA